MRTPPPPHHEMTCGFLIQLVFTPGHQSVTPFLSGATPPKNILDPPVSLYTVDEVLLGATLVSDQF